MSPQSPSDSATGADSASKNDGPPISDDGLGYRRRLRRTGSRIDRRVAAFRADDRRRRGAFGLALAVGLALTWVHWLGLVIGGALVGLTRTGLARAVFAGLTFGVLVLVGALATTPAGVTGFVVLAPASYLTIAMAVGLPTIGALARGVV